MSAQPQGTVAVERGGIAPPRATVKRLRTRLWPATVAPQCATVTGTLTDHPIAARWIAGRGEPKPGPAP
jgi:hypothetical protein